MTGGERVDVLVVGAGPAGSTAARVAAQAGLRVLVVEQHLRVGLPVQCAEYVPAQIVDYTPLTERCIAQRIRTLRTTLPDGETVESAAAGCVLDRASFDKTLAAAACRAGAELWVGARAVKGEGEWVRGRGGEEELSPVAHASRNTHNALRVLVRRGTHTTPVDCRVLIGADGPRSTVGRWIGQVNRAFVDAVQVEVVLPAPRASTEVYFDPLYRGGYGWLFPKGETANVGVGVSRELGGDPQAALAHLLERLQIGRGAVVGRTGGLVPSGGTLGSIRSGRVLLVGDAAGHTHPVTGAGIFAAVVSGTLAGQAVVKALGSDDLSALAWYEQEWDAFMGGPLRHALHKHRWLDGHWSDDPATLSAAVRQSWIAFREYGRREGLRAGD